jgi:hypothetical protein
MVDRIRDSVEAGLCVGTDGQEGDCALLSLTCTSNDESFRGSSEIQSYANAHGGSCLKGTVVRELLIGSCSNASGDGVGFCASDASLCISPSDWNAPGSAGYMHCTVAMDTSSDVLTQYGLCGKVDCAWSNEDCQESFQRSDACTCDKVRTGGCVDALGQVFCAVSASACGNGDTIQYMSPQVLRTSTNVDCFLCREFDPDAPLSGLSVTSTNSSEPNNQTALIAGLVGGAIAVLFVIFAVFISKRRRASALAATMTLNRPELQMEVEVTSSDKHASTADVEDTVSELGHND